MDWQHRTSLLLGYPALQKLQSCHVLVVGLGGVGGMLSEMLCRAGIGEMTLVDNDVIHPSNLNRQVIALQSTLGQSKVQTLAKRLQDINPDIKLHLVESFIRDEFTQAILSKPFDYVADAIDTLSPKLHLIRMCMEMKQPLVSAMGAGGKMDPTLVRIADISESHNCRLAYSIRKRLHRFGIYKGFKVVYSPEPVPDTAVRLVKGEQNKLTMVGTISYMPPIFGCFMASVILQDLLNHERIIP